MAELRLEGVEKRFGATVAADGVDLTVADGELCVLLGPSGCGKSTLLRLVAGLESVDRGTIRIGGRDVTRLPPGRRDVAMVFQSYALYPHMSVAENLAFALRRRRRPRAEVARRVAETAAMLGIEDLLERRPAQLSGGQRQRVAIGRALVREPALFLLDEPLSNLDAELRVRMRLEIATLQRRLGTTTVYVTHDQQEAMTLAHRVVLLERGRVAQAGPPLELYHQPRSRFVAGFVGSPRMNLLEGTLEEAGAGEARVRLAGGGQARAAVDARAAGPGDPVTLGIRPEHLVLDPAGGGARVLLVEHLGDHSLVHARPEGAGDATLVARVPGASPLRPGDPVAPVLDPGHVHLFAAHGRAFPRVPAPP